jgi:hypothetical protein
MPQHIVKPWRDTDSSCQQIPLGTPAPSATRNFRRWSASHALDRAHTLLAEHEEIEVIRVFRDLLGRVDWGDGSALAAGISPVLIIPRNLDSVRQRYRAALLMLSNRWSASVSELFGGLFRQYDLQTGQIDCNGIVISAAASGQ